MTWSFETIFIAHKIKCDEKKAKYNVSYYFNQMQSEDKWQSKRVESEERSTTTLMVNLKNYCAKTDHWLILNDKMFCPIWSLFCEHILSTFNNHWLALFYELLFFSTISNSLM